MVGQRYNGVLVEVLALIDRMAREHFGASEKDQTVFRVNNLSYMVSQLPSPPANRKGKNDHMQQSLQKSLEMQIEALIEIYLTINFRDLCELSKRFIKNEDDASKSQKEDPMTPENLTSLKASDLEKIGKEFLKTYKQKTDGVIKDIKSTISQNQTNQGANQSTQTPQKKDKQAGANTRKELIQRLVRILMLHFSTYIEVVKLGQFGAQSQFLRQVASNTT